MLTGQRFQVNSHRSFTGKMIMPKGVYAPSSHFRLKSLSGRVIITNPMNRGILAGTEKHPWGPGEEVIDFHLFPGLSLMGAGPFLNLQEHVRGRQMIWFPSSMARSVIHARSPIPESRHLHELPSASAPSTSACCSSGFLSKTKSYHMSCLETCSSSSLPSGKVPIPMTGRTGPLWLHLALLATPLTTSHAATSGHQPLCTQARHILHLCLCLCCSLCLDSSSLLLHVTSCKGAKCHPPPWSSPWFIVTVICCALLYFTGSGDSSSWSRSPCTICWCYVYFSFLLKEKVAFIVLASSEPSRGPGTVIFAEWRNEPQLLWVYMPQNKGASTLAGENRVSSAITLVLKVQIPSTSIDLLGNNLNEHEFHT